MKANFITKKNPLQWLPATLSWGKKLKGKIVCPLVARRSSALPWKGVRFFHSSFRVLFFPWLKLNESWLEAEGTLKFWHVLAFMICAHFLRVGRGEGWTVKNYVFFILFFFLNFSCNLFKTTQKFIWKCQLFDTVPQVFPVNKKVSKFFRSIDWKPARLLGWGKVGK